MSADAVALSDLIADFQAGDDVMGEAGFEPTLTPEMQLQRYPDFGWSASPYAYCRELLPVGPLPRIRLCQYEVIHPANQTEPTVIGIHHPPASIHSE